ncbi:acetyl-CoA synthetase-like protein, partial [Hypoxylon sp. EC38]
MASTVGQRLLPSFVDEIARSDPHRVLYSVAKTKDPAEGFLDIDAKTFARAVDRFAWYIDEQLGRGHGFPTLTYLGPQDPLYAIAVLACIKTGYKLLLNSPRNTLEQHLFLFEKTDCMVFISPVNFPLPVVKQILAARPMRHVEVPSMFSWLDGELEVKPYPYSKTFAEAKAEPFVVLHTSGSTGLPKPVIQTHATMSPMDEITALPALGQQPSYPAMCAGQRVYVTFPLFHCAGITMLLSASIYAGFTVVIGPFPPSADVANGVHAHGNVQQSCCVPTTLIELAKNPQFLENLGRLNQITYGGGPLPYEVGRLISTKTRVLNGFGSTESGVLPTQLCDPEDWAYVNFSPVGGYEYRPFSDGLYEQVIVRKPELERYQGIFGTFPELSEWRMKDLYSKHPTKENIWLYQGRADDIIVFSTGEKLNPLEMENIINANRFISAVLITGLGRFQSSLLVEAVNPPTTEAEKEELLETIWPSVQAANKESPSHGRIHRNMIVFTSADKPMLRAGKGTVQRQMTVDLYAPELDALYQAS